MGVNIVVNDLLTHYELTGKGQLVMLLHGWGDNLRSLKVLQEALSEHYQVLAVDLPGFGNSQAPQAVWDLDNYAGYVRDLLKKLDLQDVYAVVGHSNGGALAIRSISLKLIAPEKLVLMAASGIRTGHSLRRLILKIIAKLGNIATFWLPERYRRALRKYLYGVAGSDMLVAEQLQETFKKTVRQDVQADAANIAIPTLLIYGEDDRAVPLSDGRLYQHLIQNSHLEVIKHAEHFVHLDQPEQVKALIMEFLR